MNDYKNEENLKRDYPIEGKVEGWHFKITEISANVYTIEGQNMMGNQITRQCSEIELEGTMDRCNRDAEEIQRQVNKKNF